MVRGRPIGSLKVLQHRAAPVNVPPPIINPETGQVVGIYDGLCLKCQCSLYARRNWNGSIFPRLKVLLRRKDFEDNKFDKALTLEHVDSGVAFLCLLHYTGDKMENKRHFLIHFKLPEDVRIARKKQGGKLAVVIPIYKPALRRNRNVPITGYSDPGSNTTDVTPAAQTSLLVENILELESEIGQETGGTASKKRKRLSSSSLLQVVDSSETICPTVQTSADSEIGSHCDENSTIEAIQTKISKQNTPSQSLDRSQALGFLNPNVKTEPVCRSLKSFSEFLNDDESDTTTSLWEMPEIEYLETFQSSFYVNKKDYVVKEEVCSPPIAKKPRRENLRYSEAENSLEISILSSEVQLLEDANSASDVTPKVRPEFERETEKDFSVVQPDRQIDNAERTNVLESDQTNKEKPEDFNQSCSDQLATSLKQISQLDELNKNLKDLLGESLGRLKDAEDINSRLEGQIRICKQDAEAKEDALACLTGEIEACNQRLRQVEQANQTLLSDLEAKAAVIETNVQQIKLVEESYRITTLRLESCREEKDHEVGLLRSQLEGLQSRLDSSEGLIEKLGCVNKDLNRQVQACQNKNSVEETLKAQLEESRERLEEQEKRIDELKSSKSHDKEDDLGSRIQSWNVLVELRNEMMNEQEIRVKDLTSKLQVKDEILSSWTEMSRSRRMFQGKVLLQESEIQSLKERLEILETRSKEKDATMKELEVQLKFKKEALDSNNKMWSDLLTGQARQSGMRALEFELVAKENVILKEKLEKASEEIMALKDVKAENDVSRCPTSLEDVGVKEEDRIDRLKRDLRRISSFSSLDQPVLPFSSSRINGETRNRFPDV